MRTWLETRLILPFIPLVCDVLLRALALHTKLSWWQIPDLKTLCITTSFFCFLLALDVKGVGKIPTDIDYQVALDGIRKRFVTQGTVSAILFGVAAMADVADMYYGKEDLSKLILPSLASLSMALLFFAVSDSIIANLKYKLSYSA